MKSSFILLLCVFVSLIRAEGPSSVIIDGIEYIPLPKKEKTDSEAETYTIPSSSLGGMEDCWYERVLIEETSGGNTPNVGGAVVGGILGGVIGHQIGSGSGNTAATIGGAVLGSALGANANQPKTTQRYQMIRRCNTLR